MALALAILAIVLTANRASAGWFIGDVLPAYQVTYVPQKVTCWRPETFWREVDTVVEEPAYTKVTKRFNVTVLEEDFREEEHVGTFYKFVPRTFEVEVQRCRLVRTKISDPLTGNVFWIGRPEFYTERVPQIVMDRVAEHRAWTVRVPFYRPVEKTYEQDFIVCEVQYRTVKVKQPFSRLVPYESSLLVPVYVPPAVPLHP
jgi:hypothetical protein